MTTILEAGLPVRAVLRADAMYLLLKQIDVTELHDAFMFQTVNCVTAPPQAIVRIDRRHVGRELPPGAPAGVILHVGRCGSTLLSQLLKQQGSVTVYAEPLPLNELLAPPHKWPRNELVAAVRSLGAAFAQHARGPYVLKCSSWVTLFADVLLEAFPNTPWVFGMRDPVEVGVSYMKDLPQWLWGESDQARAFARILNPTQQVRSKEEHFARLFSACCDAVAQLDLTRGKLINYEALPQAVWNTLAPHFLLSIDAAQQQRMLEASRQYAKLRLGDAKQAFSQDSAEKRANASSDLIQAVELRALHLWPCC